jgi:hypothetical protein
MTKFLKKEVEVTVPAAAAQNQESRESESSDPHNAHFCATKVQIGNRWIPKWPSLQC